MCLRIESVPVAENETSEDFVNDVLDVRKNGNIKISENDIDRAHRGKLRLRFMRFMRFMRIMRFTTFLKRTLVYRGKKSIKDVRTKVDLTKKKIHTFCKS